MTPTVTLHQGDCLEVMRGMPADSIDAIVTDPPYGLGFMGKGWDALPPGEDWARECLRVLKSGGHLLAFGGTRTWHRLAVAIEDAGFEIRDSIAWLYGSGFPKSLDVSKAIDKAAGADREITGRAAGAGAQDRHSFANGHRPEYDITAPATHEAAQWQGWGTALKPAHEPCVVARKPLVGTVAVNVLAHGTGALNIDGCRITTDEPLSGGRYADLPDRPDGAAYGAGINKRSRAQFEQPAGRWPANIILDEHTAAAVDDQQADVSRFFYVAKAPKSERPIVDGIAHPTVKPLTLMRHLVRLVTPPGGVVLDPFAGSGTTLQAARAEGFDSIGIEQSHEYVRLVEARLGTVTTRDEQTELFAHGN